MGTPTGGGLTLLAKDAVHEAMHDRRPQHVSELWQRRPDIVAEARPTVPAALLPGALGVRVQLAMHGRRLRCSDGKR